MHDKNGKQLKVGDNIHTYMHDALLTITAIDTNHHEEGEYLTAKTDKGDSCGYSQAVAACEVMKVRTWKELAQEALQVQNASNLSGVSRTFAQVVAEVRYRLDSEGKGGNPNLHSHPIIQVWVDKLASLTGTQGSWNAVPTYNVVHDLAEKEEVPQAESPSHNHFGEVFMPDTCPACKAMQK